MYVLSSQFLVKCNWHGFFLRLSLWQIVFPHACHPQMKRLAYWRCYSIRNSEIKWAREIVGTFFSGQPLLFAVIIIIFNIKTEINRCEKNFSFKNERSYHIYFYTTCHRLFQTTVKWSSSGTELWSHWDFPILTLITLSLTEICAIRCTNFVLSL